jgi:hypothetical protein
MERYAIAMHLEIVTIIDHATTRVLVAEEPGEVDHVGRPFVYGFAAYSDEALINAKYVYYVYVKTPYRQGRKRHHMAKGYGAILLEACGVDVARPFEYACRTSYCDTLASKIPLATFDPLPARYLEPPTHEQRSQVPAAAVTAQAIRANERVTRGR